MMRKLGEVRRRVLRPVPEEHALLGQVLANACDDFLAGKTAERRVQYRGRSLLIRSMVFPWAMTVRILTEAGEHVREPGEE